MRAGFTWEKDRAHSNSVSMSGYTSRVFEGKNIQRASDNRNRKRTVDVDADCKREKERRERGFEREVMGVLSRLQR